MPCPDELYHIECKKTIRNLNGTDSAELSQYSYNGSFTDYDRRSFQFQNGKKKTPFTVTKMNTVDMAISSINPIFMTGLLLLQNRTQDVKMIKNIFLTKIAGHY